MNTSEIGVELDRSYPDLVNALTFAITPVKGKLNTGSENTVIWYHDGCNDGLTALAVIVNKLMRDNPIGSTKYYPVDYPFCSKLKDGKLTTITSQLTELVSKSSTNVHMDQWNEELFIVDFNFPVSDLGFILTRFSRITIIDHHPLIQPAEDFQALMDTYPDRITFVHSIERSGAYLAYLYCYYHDNSFADESTIPWPVILADDNDRWQHKYIHTKPFIEGIWGGISGVPDRLNALLELCVSPLNVDSVFERSKMDAIVERGNMLLTAKSNEKSAKEIYFDEFIKTAIIYNIFVETPKGCKPVKVATFNVPAIFRSELPDYYFKSLTEDNGIDLAIVWSCVGEGNYRYSARGNANSSRIGNTDPNAFYIEAKALAESFGGSGHPNAAGFYSNKTPDKLFIR